jgi:DNA-binding NtrC family response regulator
MKAELEKLIDQMISHGVLFEEAVQEFEKQFILRVVTRNRHNLSKAAVELGIHRNTLTKRLQVYHDGASANGHARRQVAPRRKSHS